MTASTRPAPSPDVRAFDVRRDARPAVAPLRALRRLHGAFADQVGAIWSESLRADVEAECVLVEIVSAGDLLRGLPAITVLAPVTLDPLPGEALLEFDAPLGLVAVERLLGGSGRVRDLRAPTLVESELLAALVERTASGLARALEPLHPVRPTVAELAFDPTYVRLGSATDPVTLIALRLRIEADGHVTEGTMTLCYPERTVAPLVEALGSADREEPTAAAPVTGPLAPLVQDLPLPVTVQLATTAVPAGDIVALQPGDVLRLEHRVGSDVLGVADDQLVLTGRIGRKGMRLAMELSIAPQQLLRAMTDDAGADDVPAVVEPFGTAPTATDPWAADHGAAHLPAVRDPAVSGDQNPAPGAHDVR